MTVRGGSGRAGSGDHELGRLVTVCAFPYGTLGVALGGGNGSADPTRPLPYLPVQRLSAAFQRRRVTIAPRGRHGSP